MQPNQPTGNNIRQAVMLDLSLFILDLLDARKIQERAEIRNHILEIPSALVQMLRDSRVGSPILFLFVYSLLVKIINQYREKHITDQRIVRLVNSPDYTIRGEASRITQRLFDEFSSLIDIEPKATSSDDLDNPIRRYDAIGSFSRDDQRRLQEIYTRELNLPEHPLYDQYFSQIYHAQAIGLTAESSFRRRTVSLGDETFQIVSTWKGKTNLDERSNVVQTSREFLRWFITNYIKSEWKDIAFDATLELSVAGVLTGSAAGFGVSLVTLAGGTIIKAIVEAPPEIIHPDWKPILVIGVVVLMFVCLIILVRPTWFIRRALPTPLSVSLPTSSPSLFLQDTTPTITPITTSTSIATSTFVAPIQILATSTFLPINSSTISNSPDYCLYVVQPGDTIQSVASWFYISEFDIRNSDARVNREIFTLHQLIRINAPCCTHIGVNNGRSYSVQPKDNVFKLAANFSISVEKIISANNLNDSRYIQTGQMLCIPYP